MNIRDKISGALYGQFIGDALGTRYEFSRSVIVMDKIKKDMVNNFLPILGEGPFNVKKGQVTDDTELAMALLYSLANNLTYDKNDVAKRYLKWYHSKPFDIGNTTRNALGGASSYDEIVANSKEYCHNSLSNGCLMRISPLALFGCSLNNQELFRFCEQDTLLTNPNPICIDAVKVFCIALKISIFTKDKQYIFKHAYNASNNSLIKSILGESLIRPDSTLLENGQRTATDIGATGYLGVALQNAFYELMNGSNFYDSLVNIIKRGGDTDTNACIAGSLLGAYYGKDKIPNEWIKSVQINNPRTANYPEIEQKNLDVMINTFANIILQNNVLYK